MKKLFAYFFSWAILSGTCLVVFVSCNDEDDAPVITSFSPLEGKAGTVVTINGQNFGSAASDVTVTFGSPATSVAAISANGQQITVSVPPSAQTAELIVTVKGRSVQSADKFTALTNIIIFSLTPPSGVAGDQVTISGSGFSSSISGNKVTFNGGQATVVEASATQLKVVIPPDGTYGDVSVENDGGNATKPYSVHMNVTSVSPSSAKVGDKITIKGTGLAGLLLTWNEFAMPQTTVSPTEVIARLPYLEKSMPQFNTTAPIVVYENWQIDSNVPQRTFTSAPFTLVDEPSVIRRTDFPGTVTSNAFSFGLGDFVYVGAGYKNGETTNPIPTGDLWRFNITNNSWDKLSDFPGAARVWSTTFVSNGKAYVVGGNTSPSEQSSLTELWEYDPVANSWTRKADFPGTARVAAVAVTIGTNNYYGLGNGGSKDWWSYNAVDNTWTQKASAPKSLEFASAIDMGGKVVVLGGYAPTGNQKQVLAYNPGTDQWTVDSQLTVEPFRNSFLGSRSLKVGEVFYFFLDEGFYELAPPSSGQGFYQWVKIRVPNPIQIPIPNVPGAFGVLTFRTGACVIAQGKGFIWYGSKEFWEFTPPK